MEATATTSQKRGYRLYCDAIQVANYSFLAVRHFSILLLIIFKVSLLLNYGVFATTFVGACLLSYYRIVSGIVPDVVW